MTRNTTNVNTKMTLYGEYQETNPCLSVICDVHVDEPRFAGDIVSRGYILLPHSMLTIH